MNPPLLVEKENFLVKFAENDVTHTAQCRQNLIAGCGTFFVILVATGHAVRHCGLRADAQVNHIHLLAALGQFLAQTGLGLAFAQLFIIFIELIIAACCSF